MAIHPKEVQDDATTLLAARRKYRIWQMSRPPFSDAPRKPKYSQIDEQEIFKFETAVFNTARYTTPPSDSLRHSEDLKAEFWLMQNADRELRDNIDRQKQFFRIEEGPLVNLIQKVRLQISKNEMDETLNPKGSKKQESLVLKLAKSVFRNDRKSCDQKESIYLQSVMAYHQMLCHETRETDPETSMEAAFIAEQAEMVFLAFQTYLTVRSFMHDSKDGVTRDSGEVKVQHVYEVSLHQMNRYLEKLQKTESHEEKLTIMREMKISVMSALLHDFLEDHRHIPAENLESVLSGRARFDSRLISAINNHEHALGLPSTSLDMLAKYWPEVIERVKALTKPKDHDERPGYINRQIFESTTLSPNAKVDVIITKIFDRHNNLKTLRYMKDKVNEKTGKIIERGCTRQIRKISETIELLDVAMEVYKAFKGDPNVRWTQDILFHAGQLTEVCYEELDRLEGRKECDAHNLMDIEMNRRQISKKAHDLQLLYLAA